MFRLWLTEEIDVTRSCWWVNWWIGVDQSFEIVEELILALHHILVFFLLFLAGISIMMANLTHDVCK